MQNEDIIDFDNKLIIFVKKVISILKYDITVTDSDDLDISLGLQFDIDTQRIVCSDSKICELLDYDFNQSNSNIFSNTKEILSRIYVRYPSVQFFEEKKKRSLYLLFVVLHEVGHYAHYAHVGKEAIERIFDQDMKKKLELSNRLQIAADAGDRPENVYARHALEYRDMQSETFADNFALDNLSTHSAEILGFNLAQPYNSNR